MIVALKFGCKLRHRGEMIDNFMIISFHSLGMKKSIFTNKNILVVLISAKYIALDETI